MSKLDPVNVKKLKPCPPRVVVAVAPTPSETDAAVRQMILVHKEALALALANSEKSWARRWLRENRRGPFR